MEYTRTWDLIKQYGQDHDGLHAHTYILHIILNSNNSTTQALSCHKEVQTPQKHAEARQTCNLIEILLQDGIVMCRLLIA